MKVFIVWYEDLNHMYNGIHSIHIKKSTAEKERDKQNQRKPKRCYCKRENENTMYSVTSRKVKD